MAHVDLTALANAVDRLKSSGLEVDVETSLKRAVQFCVDLFAVDGGGVMLADAEGDLRYVVAQDTTSRQMEQGQSATGVGPCVDAYTSGRVVFTDDVQQDERWPALNGALADSAVHAVLSVPLHSDGVPVGSFDVYVRTRRVWDIEEQEALRRYGEIVDVLLGSALAAESTGDVAAQLQTALDRRITIDRAVGFLMARHGTSSVEAFDRLRRHARQRRSRVADVAAFVLEGGELDVFGDS